MAESTNLSAAHLTIEGRVQGVYYRASTVQEAQNLNLNGWVMNCPDGSVQAWAEGSRENIEQLIAWCHQGPQGARVTKVAVTWREPQHCSGFQVRR